MASGAGAVDPVCAAWLTLHVGCAADLPGQKHAWFLAGLRARCVDADGAAEPAHAEGRADLRDGQRRSHLQDRLHRRHQRLRFRGLRSVVLETAAAGEVLNAFHSFENR